MGRREFAAAGALFALAILLIWAGWSGRMGLILGAILCPSELEPTS